MNTAQGVVIQDKTIKRNGKTFKQYWIDQPTDNNNNASGVQS